MHPTISRPPAARRLAGLAALALCATAVASAQAPANPSDSATAPGLAPLFLPKRPAPLFQQATKWTPEMVREHTPSTPNPYLSFLPVEAEVEWDYWEAKAALEGKARAAAMPASRGRTIGVTDTEDNDTFPNAQVVAGAGTAPGQDPQVSITGSLAAGGTNNFAETENNDSIPNADVLNLVNTVTTIISGAVGGASAANGDNDADYFRFNASEGDLFTARTELGTLDDTVLYLFDAAGSLVAYNDDISLGFQRNSLIQISIPADGTYYIVCGSWDLDIPDPNTGAGVSGGNSSGSYTLEVALNGGDLDFYAFDLQAGDIIGATLNGDATLAIFDTANELMIGSAQDISFILPAESTLPGGGDASAAAIAPADGRYYVAALQGVGAYNMTVRFERPVLERAPERAVQYLFVDFDGGTFNAAATVGGNNPANISPLSAFLSGWGIPANQESDLIDAILASMEESLATDARTMGSNGARLLSGVDGEFDIVLLNSRDHPDPFGLPNVSRVVVGGTIDELGVSTIGIAESIDPGNYGTEETAFTLLDLLSSSPDNGNSLNQFPLALGATRLDIVGVAVGNISAHEAGHFFGNFHTNQFNASPNIMDQGGNLPNTIGFTGPNWGDGDEVDVDFGPDTFVSSEGFVGTEDTLELIAFGLSTGTGPGANFELLSGELRYTGTPGADTYVVSQLNTESVNVIENGDLRTWPGQAGYAVSSVTINSGGGGDSFDITPSTNQPYFIDGGGEQDGLTFDGLNETLEIEPSRNNGTLDLEGYAETVYGGIEDLVIENTKPSLAGIQPLQVQAGTTYVGLKVADVQDFQEAPENLTVAIVNEPIGVTVTNVQSTPTGVTADVLVDCSRFNGIGTLMLEVTDGAGLSQTGNAIFQFQANPAPFVGLYNSTSTAAGGSAIALPTAVPTDDNGNLASVTVSPETLPGGGTLFVDAVSGIVTINTTGATPTGNYPVQVTVADECGEELTRNFVVEVTAGVEDFLLFEP